MTTIETIKYQNDYTGEVFDNYEECFNSETNFMFNKDNSGVIAVFDNGRIGNITEVFDKYTPSGLDAYRINAIICSSAKRPMTLSTTSSLIGMKLMGRTLNLLMPMFAMMVIPIL